jgi:hypothetical protein
MLAGLLFRSPLLHAGLPLQEIFDVVVYKKLTNAVK